MEEDPEFVRLSNEYQLKSQKEMTREEKLLRKRALDNLGESSKVHPKQQKF